MQAQFQILTIEHTITAALSLKHDGTLPPS